MGRAMGLSAERSAKNEGRFRELNDELEQKRVELLGEFDHRPTPFLCECEDLACTDVLAITLHDYETARGTRRRFLISPGHVADNAKVVARRETHWLVEKQGEAGRVAEAEASDREAAR
jgi:hypothetical protein